MSGVIRKREYQEENVYEAALDRIRYCFDMFDNVVVSFSGGKDSTAVLNLALTVAKERDALPLKVIFFDEEAIHPPTIEYVQRCADSDLIDLDWYCLEFKHRNACSNAQPFWYCWNKEKEDLWTRSMPEAAITEHPRFKKGMSFQEFAVDLFDKSDGMTCQLTGVRTQESIMRVRAVSRKKNDNYITVQGHFAMAHPIYDWSSDDVWLGVAKLGWDYNHTYDIFDRTRQYGNYLAQRVCPPYGEEPIRGLWIYATCFPEMWSKMIERVPGVSTAWRYANTNLYGRGKRVRPDHLTFRAWLNIILEGYDGALKAEVKSNIAGMVRRHNEVSALDIQEETYDPITGISWSFLCKLAIKGDLKNRAKSSLETNAEARRKRLGLESYLDAVKLHGTDKLKQKEGIL